MTGFQFAQANIGRFRASIDSPVTEHGPTPHVFRFRTPFPAPGGAAGEVEELDAIFCDTASDDPPRPQ